MGELNTPDESQITGSKRISLRKNSLGVRRAARHRRTPPAIQPGYRLQDLIDIAQFQALQDRLNEIYSFPSAIIDREGNILTATAWQDVCTKFHRVHPNSKLECIHSDEYIDNHINDANPAVSYRCPHGLVDNAAPIIIAGVYYGNFFTGQFFLEAPNMDFFRAQAQRYGFDEEAYLRAVAKVPVWSQKQLDSYLFFIKGLIEVISSSGLKKLKEIENRKKIEENEERASTILRQMSDGFWITSGPSGKIMDVNPSMCQMLGYTRSELLRMSVADVEASDSVREIEERIVKVVTDGTANFESRFRCKNGTLIDVEISVTYIKSSDLFFGFHRDVTERKQVEKWLRERDQQFRSITAASPDTLLVSRLSDGLVLYANDQSRRTLGLNQLDSGINFTPDFYTNPADRETFLKMLSHGTAENYEVLLKRADGSRFWAMISARLGTFEGQAAIYAGLHDITDRKDAENELQKSEYRFRQLFENHNAMMLLIDPVSGEIVDANAAAAQFYGYPRAELVGMNIAAIAVLSPEQIRANRQSADRQENSNFSLKHHLANGEIRNVEVRTTPIETGERRVLFSIVRDVTELAQAEELARKINRELRAVSSCNQVLVRAEDEQTLLNQICRIVCEEAGYRMAWVGYAEEDSAKTIRPVAWAGFEDGYLASAYLTWDDSESGRGPAGSSIRSGNMVYTQDFASDQQVNLWRSNALARDFHSSISLPLKDLSGHTFGVFSIYSAEVNAFTPNEIRLLEELSDDLAFGIVTIRGRAEHKRAEKALLESEERFRSFIEESSDGVVILDEHGQIITWNRAEAQITGIPPESALGKPFWEIQYQLLPPHRKSVRTPEYYRQTMQANFQTGTSPHFYRPVESDIETVGGQTKTIIQTSFPIRSQIGYRVGGLVRDISDRKQAEKALRESEARFSRVFQDAPVLITITDMETSQYIDVNDEALRVSGFRRDEVIGRKSTETGWITPADRAHLVAEMQQHHRITGLEMNFHNKDGSQITGLVNGELIVLNGRDCLLTVTLDVTERKHAEQALVQSQEQLQAIVQTANDAIITIDSQQTIAFWNNAAEKIFGYPTAEVVGKSVHQIVPGEFRDQNTAALRRFFSGSDPFPTGFTMETTGITRAGNRIPIEMSFAAWRSEAGQFVTAIIRDISERQQREHELQAITVLSAALRTAPTRGEMLPVVVAQTVKLLNCDAVSIEMLDSSSGEMSVAASHGAWKSLSGARQPDAEILPAVPAPVSPTGSPALQDTASVPLIAQKQLIGYIHAGKQVGFTDSQVGLLSAIGDISANAIYRATLHEQTQKDAKNLSEAYDTTLEGWAHALELRDQETEGHTRRVTAKTVELARRMGVAEQNLENIRRGALLHDIGKMGIPDSVLLKPGTLNEREWEIMRRHPEYSLNLLNQIEYLRPALAISYCHHEKWDGSGYPRGLQGSQIPLEARIFAVVDVWDALTSDRVYRKAWSAEDATRYVDQHSGSHFDPDVVKVFLEMLADQNADRL
jgi:PAS domain S-box-containing protein/putative nucleotidyltransferase with HDIG domain